jgi:hypothetical protein
VLSTLQSKQQQQHYHWLQQSHAVGYKGVLRWSVHG